MAYLDQYENYTSVLWHTVKHDKKCRAYQTLSKLSHLGSFNAKKLDANLTEPPLPLNTQVYTLPNTTSTIPKLTHLFESVAPY